MTALYEAFDAYLLDRTPQQWERDEVTRYRKRLYEALDLRFGLLAFFQSGSFSNGTGISMRSDVDYIARLPMDTQPSSSTTALRTVRDFLSGELHEATSVTISRPTVSVDFSGVVTAYEIVPSYLHSGDDDDTVLSIPGPDGTWIQSAPKAHLKYVTDANKLHNGGVKELARLLKSWKYEHDVPVSSFYLEMRAAQHGHTNTSIWHLTSLRNVLKAILDGDVRDMNDPLQLVNRIPSCSSQANRSQTARQMRVAVEHLYVAAAAWFAKRYSACTQQLQHVFGYGFSAVTEGP